MQKQFHSMCLRRFDFASYLSGATYGDKKAALERHLCDCDDCFNTLMIVLNQQLNQTHALLAGLPMIGRAHSRSSCQASAGR